MAKNTNSVYSDEELAILENNINIRVKIVDVMTANGKVMPTKTNEIRVLNEVLSATDKSVHDKVGNRVKHTAAVNDAANAELIAGILAKVQVYGGVVNPDDANKIVTLEKNNVPVELVPGHTDIETEQLDIRLLEEKQ